jgi:hypothetical protein
MSTPEERKALTEVARKKTMKLAQEIENQGHEVEIGNQNWSNWNRGDLPNEIERVDGIPVGFRCEPEFAEPVFEIGLTGNYIFVADSLEFETEGIEDVPGEKYVLKPYNHDWLPEMTKRALDRMERSKEPYEAFKTLWEQKRKELQAEAEALDKELEKAEDAGETEVDEETQKKMRSIISKGYDLVHRRQRK